MIATVAPSCGIPVESRTWPESFPALVMDLLEVCAASRGAHPEWRKEGSRSTGAGTASLAYLPGVTFAAVFCSTALFTVNSAEREMVELDNKSVALTSRVYFPGANVASGKSLSMVT